MVSQYEQFFLNPTDKKHLYYEALRKSFVENLSDRAICRIYQLKFNSFRSLKRDFRKMVAAGKNPAELFFASSKAGKREKTQPAVCQKIIALRVKNLSVPDIKAILSSEGIHISLWKIDRILKEHNFPVLARRTQQNKQQIVVPDEFKPPESCGLEFPICEKFESLNGSVFLLYPLLKEINISKIVSESGYPSTKQISALNAVLSFLALKLIDTKRLSHSNDYSLDRGLGLFAGLNVLPKNAWFGSYSYRINRKMNVNFLKALNHEVEKQQPSSGDFNLDFTTIPHWGEASVLENNWSATRRIGLKSVFALLVQEQDNKLLKYGDAEIKHTNQSDAILEFIDFYKPGGNKINCLIFDSKFTKYRNLNQLNKANIKFLTLRRRSKNLIAQIENIDKEHWKRVRLSKKFRRKYRNLLVYETEITLDDYEGQLRQLAIKNSGRENPAFIITNDFNLSLKETIIKYARRWLVEQEISEQIEFYHLNRLNSSIVVKVDFDLTMSILADTMYKLFSEQIPGFQESRADGIYRSFIKNYSHFHIEDKPEKIIKITLNKKVHLPLLYETDWFSKGTKIPWLGDYKLKYEIGTSL
jgi:hypothetical protein